MALNEDELKILGIGAAGSENPDSFVTVQRFF
jgi:hypothetical protein